MVDSPGRLPGPPGPSAGKVKAIYGYVVQKTRYVALEFGIEGFTPRRCAQTVARGWGDCKDKATVIVTMLRDLGIPAELVLVRTGQRGLTATDMPSWAMFDHAIAYVPSLDLYLDGTAEYTGMTELPAMDRGAIAQLGTPEDLYGTPVNAYVADFIGSANVIPVAARIVDGSGAAPHVRYQLAGRELDGVLAIRHPI